MRWLMKLLGRMPKPEKVEPPARTDEEYQRAMKRIKALETQAKIWRIREQR